MPTFPTPIYPYPEILKEGRWTLLSDEAPRVSPEALIMSVPSGTSAHHRFIRAHEMLHVALSPDNLPEICAAFGVDIKVVQAVEEARINSVIERRLDIHMPTNHLDLDPTFSSYERGHQVRISPSRPHKVAIALLGIHGREVEQANFLAQATVSAAFMREALDLYRGSIDFLWLNVPEGEVPGFERVVFIAKALADDITPWEMPEIKAAVAKAQGDGGAAEAQPPTSEPTEDTAPQPTKEEPKEPEEPKDAGGADEGTDGAEEPAQEPEPASAAPAEEPPPQPEEELTALAAQVNQATADAVAQAMQEILAKSGKPGPRIPQTIESQAVMIPDWGKLKIHHPRLRSPSVDTKHGRRRRRLSEEGVIPRALWREEVDGAIFEQRTRGRHLSMLIDCSGSMDLDERELQDFLNVVPAAVIGLYSGEGFRRQGNLVVVAEKRRRLRSGRDFDQGTRPIQRGGSNEVDLPALQWLARQLQPRVWVSDGGVFPSGFRNSLTGARTRAGPAYTSGQQVLQQCLTSRIYQFLDLPAALAAVRQNNLGEPRYRISGLSKTAYSQAGVKDQ